MKKRLRKIRIRRNKRQPKGKCRKNKSKKRSKLRITKGKNWRLRRSWLMPIWEIFQMMLASRMMRIDT